MFQRVFQFLEHPSWAWSSEMSSTTTTQQARPSRPQCYVEYKVKVLVKLNQCQTDWYRPPLFCLESVLTHRIVSTKKDKTQACWQVCCGEGGHPHAAPSVLTTWLLFGFLQKARGRKEKQWLPCFQGWGNSGDITKIPGICICFPLFWLLNIAKEGF